MTTRRDFIRAMGAGAVAASPLGVAACRAARPVPAGLPVDYGWEAVPEILARIKPPTLSNREFDHHALRRGGDGRTDATDAIRRAIAACASAGGGRVVVPAGSIRDRTDSSASNVKLHVSRDATLAVRTGPERNICPRCSRASRARS